MSKLWLLDGAAKFLSTYSNKTHLLMFLKHNKYLTVLKCDPAALQYIQVHDKYSHLERTLIG